MPKRVTINSDRITIADGQPFFLIGARHMPDGGTPQLLRDAGFNAYRVLAFGHEAAEPETVPGDLEGIAFWSYLYDRPDLAKSPDYERELRQKVRELRHHPSLLCHENLNEPTLCYRSARYKAQPEALSRGAAVVREEDPDHPLWLAHTCTNTVETLRRYNACADVIGCNPYPVHVAGMRKHIGVRPDGRMLDCPDQSIHAVGRYTEKMMKVTADRMPVWMLLQALANENWYSPVHTPALAAEGIDESRILYPTYEEMRFMAFDAIAHGATGLALSMWKTPVEGKAWQGIRRLVAALRDLHDALCAPPVRERAVIDYTDLGFTVWDGVRVLARRSKDSLYVFAVNTQFDPAEALIRLRSLEGATSALVVHEDREVAVVSGAVRDRFAPHGVHVYRARCAP